MVFRLSCAAAEEVVEAVAALAMVAGCSHDASSLFSDCAADWAAFADELALQLPWLAEELEQQLQAVSAAADHPAAACSVLVGDH